MSSHPSCTPLPFIAFSQWRHYARIQQRVIGQLLQTLLYEDVLSYRFVPHSLIADSSEPGNGEARDVRSGNGRFLVELGAVNYEVHGWLCDSFELVRLDHSSLLRMSVQHEPEQPDLHTFLADLKTALGDQAMQPGFVEELEQTLVKDLQSAAEYTAFDKAFSHALKAHHALKAPHSLKAPQQLDADALEQYFTDAHSYHPCYKSRLGFSLDDNRRYGPEFGADIRVLWLAVPKQYAHFSAVERLDAQAFVAAQAGEDVLARLAEYLQRRQLAREDVVLLPVHPWQWQNSTVQALHAELASGEVACLGEGDVVFTAQQSIRTLAPQDSSKAYLKLAMSITNTSSTRILARHTVTNGPIVTQWLQRLIASDETARRAGFVILGEVAGAALDERAFPAARYPKVYGTLGAIWRENVASYLQDGEQAVPFNGLSQHEKDAEGTPSVPFIGRWIEQHGLKAWTQQLLNVTIVPIIHMLYAEGMGMESHGQNIVVIHRDGWPQRIALKDFHDGIRYSPAHLARPQLAPELEPVPASHAALNRNSFIITDDVNAVRDFSCDAFFFIALGEMAIFLRRYFDLAENEFWAMAAKVIIDYQNTNPQHRERFALFDVFAPTYEVEALTKRRLFGDAEAQIKIVPNPLAPFRPQDLPVAHASEETATC
uniref:IucA/IucC family protein n=1 Tax=Halomonas sp. TaxID=1486246 RepID=UPI002621B05A|nr:IucA/IucC family protein [Halomonas sp.]